MAILVISVDLGCCYSKAWIEKVLGCLKEAYSIEKIEYEYKINKVIVRGKFDAEKLRRMIWCKACKVVKDIEIVEVWPPKPPTPPPSPPKPECKLLPIPYPLPYPVPRQCSPCQCPPRPPPAPEPCKCCKCKPPPPPCPPTWPPWCPPTWPPICRPPWG